MSVVIVLQGCNKSQTTSSFTDNTDDQPVDSLQSRSSQLAIDQYVIGNDEDNIEWDVRFASEKVPAFDSFTAARNVVDKSTFGWATIDRTMSVQKLRKFQIKYTGVKDTFGYLKTGTLTVELIKGQRWDLPGAVVQLVYDSLKITVNGRTRKYVGKKTITSTNGGFLFDQNRHEYHVRASGTVSFGDTATATFWSARKLVLDFPNKETVCTSEGDSLLASANGSLVSMAGTDRSGQSYYVASLAPIVAKSDCGFTFSSGSRKLVAGNKDITVTYGVDGTGTPAACGCPFRFKINWKKLDGSLGSLLLSY